MNLTSARLHVRQFARSANDPATYSAADIDRAIQTVCDQFIFETQCLKKISSIALTSGSAVASLTALATFRPERLLAAYVTGQAEPLDVVPWEELYANQVDAATDGPPTQLAFEDWTTANVYPTPDEALTLKLRWVEPFTVWTPGDTDPGTLNLPDDWLRTILTYGATAVLQHNVPEHRYASESWRKYLEFEGKMRGAGNLGARTVKREMLAE